MNARQQAQSEIDQGRTRALGITPSPLHLPSLSRHHRGTLALALLRDVMLVGLRVPGCQVHVMLAGDDDPEPVRAVAPAGVSVSHLPRPGSGDMQRQAIASLLSSRSGPVALIDASVPTLPATIVDRAFEALESGRASLVLGPSPDSGCYLIATDRDHPDLFASASDCKGDLLKHLLERAEELRLEVELLPEWETVSDAAGLERLVDALGMNGSLSAPATRAALQSLGRAGAPLPAAPTPWTVTSRTLHFHSSWRSFVEESLVNHNGESGEYSYLDAPDAVWVVPVTHDGEIVLVRQYRHPARTWVLEVPAGALEGMPSADAAHKELREEVGGVATEMCHLGEFYGSSGNSTHRACYYLAFGVTLGETEHESTELIEIVTVPVELAFDMAARGEISDGQSALAVLLARDRIRARLATAPHDSDPTHP